MRCQQPWWSGFVIVVLLGLVGVTVVAGGRTVSPRAQHA